MRRKPWPWLPALLAGAVIIIAQASAQPRAEPALRDPEFGVSNDAIGLERRVAMYQWRAAGDGYARVWSTQPIDSSDFAPGHENVGAFPLHGKRWLAEQVMFDGRPVASEAVDSLARWQPMRPDFSALPGNLAATFQPEGDGLGSAINPLDPRIGDLRITWHERVLPPLDGKLELRDGRWQLAPGALAQAANEPVTHQRRTWLFGGAWWWLAGALLLVLLAVAGFVIARKRR